MKLLRVVVLGAVFWVGDLSNARADVIINSAYSEATGTLVSDGGIQDSITFKSSAHTVNDSVIGSRNITLGNDNSLGQGNYSFSDGNTAIHTLPQNRWDLGVSTQAIYAVSSNQAVAGESFEKFNAVLEFTITGQNYEGAVQLFSQLIGPNSASLGSQDLYGSLSSGSNGLIYEMSRTRNNTGATSFSSTFPTQLLLTPDTYKLEMTLSGMRDVPYNGSLSGFGALSISVVAVPDPIAVPEPGSMAMLACAAVLGGQRLLRLRKRQRSTL